jgi:hypothetical protein
MRRIVDYAPICEELRTTSRVLIEDSRALRDASRELRVKRTSRPRREQDGGSDKQGIHEESVLPEVHPVADPVAR